MISHKECRFQDAWRRTTVVAGLVVVFTGYLLWRYAVIWPLVLLAVVVGGGLLYLLYAFRMADARRRAALDERDRALEEQSRRLSAVHKVADALREIVDQVRKAATEHAWPIDLDQFDAKAEQARQAAMAENYADAMPHLTGAITSALQQRRDQQNSADKSDESQAGLF